MRYQCVVLAAVGAVLVYSRPAVADNKLATVEGVVTYKGKPLPDATITLHLADDQFVGAKLKDGKYRVDRVPSGTVTVTITSAKVRLPAKFAGPDTSGLTVEVKAGIATFDFDLAD